MKSRMQMHNNMNKLMGNNSKYLMSKHQLLKVKTEHFKDYNLLKLRRNKLK